MSGHSSDGTYHVRFESPGDNLIQPGTSEDMECAGVSVMVGQLKSGEWLSWVPYYEETHRDTPVEPKQAIAENKFVAAGAIQDYYWGDRSADAATDREEAGQ